MKKRILGLTIILAIALISFVGCGNSSNDANKSIDSKEENTKIETSNNTDDSKNEIDSNNTEGNSEDNKPKNNDEKEDSNNKSNKIIIRRMVTDITNIPMDSAGISLKIAGFLSNILNNGQVFLVNEAESKAIVKEILKKTKNKNNYKEAISQIEDLGNNFFENPNDVKELIEESGNNLNSSYINKDEFDKILNILKN